MSYRIGQHTIRAAKKAVRYTRVMYKRAALCCIDVAQETAL